MTTTDGLQAELDLDGLAGLIADAAQVRLPAPRAPRVVIDLTIPAPRTTITIPDDAVGLVNDYTDYGA